MYLHTYTYLLLIHWVSMLILYYVYTSVVNTLQDIYIYISLPYIYIYIYIVNTYYIYISFANTLGLYANI
jgi:hypothetical protein